MNKDYESYRVSQNNNHSGAMRVARDKIKKTKKKSLQRKVKIASAITAFSLIVYGGISLGVDAKKTVNKIEDNIEYYQQQKQSMAFTNLTFKEFDSMNNENKISLLKNYVNYLEQNANIYDQEIARDFSISKNSADVLNDQIETLKGAWNQDDLERQQRIVMDKYYEAINTVNQLYPGKYNLYMENENMLLVDNNDYSNAQTIARR